MESDDPICVHFIYKCNIQNNAQIMGELSYILLNTSCIQLILDLSQLVFKFLTCVFLEDKTFLFGTLFHHKKFRGFGLFVRTSLSFGSWLSHSLFHGLSF
jgi:hypothetical protein